MAGICEGGREKKRERECLRDRDWYKKQKIIGEEMESNDLMNDEKTIAIMNEKKRMNTTYYLESRF